jgi:2,4-diketo-3-deoxy-L-fuconate hydrolase
MKLLRYGPPGKENPALLDAGGVLRDVSALIPDIGPAQLGDAVLARLGRLKPETLPKVRGRPRIGCPVAGVGKFIAIGLNYADHAAEAGLPVPGEPVVFTKAISCIQGPDDPVMLPKGSKKSDWEVELGVVIGRTARHVARKDALTHVAGYCVVNDVSEREFQIERGGTWDKGKGCDTFGPIGPWLVTRDEVPNPQRLGLWLDLNGQRMQGGSTRTMVFGVAQLISYVSRFITLQPGDVLTTGTPPGVGMGRRDAAGQPAPRYLKKDDVMTLGIDGLGQQRQQVVAFRAPCARPPDRRPIGAQI